MAAQISKKRKVRRSLVSAVAPSPDVVRRHSSDHCSQRRPRPSGRLVCLETRALACIPYLYRYGRAVARADGGPGGNSGVWTTAASSAAADVRGRGPVVPCRIAFSIDFLYPAACARQSRGDWPAGHHRPNCPDARRTTSDARRATHSAHDSQRREIHTNTNSLSPTACFTPSSTSS